MRPLVREWLIWWYGKAMRQIHPLHADVPHIVLRLSQLTGERQGRTVGAKTRPSPNKTCANSY